MPGKIGKSSREITPGPLGLWLDRGILATLFLFVIAAPNSIAATQTAWLLGLLLWALRLFVWPRPRLHRTPLDYALLGQTKSRRARSEETTSELQSRSDLV